MDPPDAFSQDRADASDALEDAYYEYLDAVAAGAAEPIDAFCARHAAVGAPLRDRLRELIRLVGIGVSAGEDRAVPAGGGLPRIDGFHVLCRLSRGGMGELYFAEQKGLGRKVALKVLRPERRGSIASESAFQREARALAALRHPSIVTIHAAGVQDGVAWIAMELLAGRSFDEWLAEARANEVPAVLGKILRFGAQIARALEAAHAERIIHRDVKPSNILVLEDDRAVLVDFGIARHFEEDRATLTGEFRGTPTYASPEQIKGGSAPLDARTDVYSLGVTLYEAVTGTLPFGGDTTEQLFHAILSGAAPPPRRVQPALSRDAETVILKAMERDPRRRYADARALAEDLEALVEIRPIRARPSGPLARIVKWSRRNRALSTALAAVAALGIVGAGMEVAANRRKLVDLRRELAAARGLVERGEHQAALAACDRALGRLPDDVDAARLRDAVIRSWNESRCDAALAAARRHLDDCRGRAERIADLRGSVAGSVHGVNTRHLAPAEHRRLRETEDAVAALEREQVRDFLLAAERAQEARAIAPLDPRVDAFLAELWMEQWREAVGDDDQPRAAWLAERVRAIDRAGRHAAELEPRRRLAMESDPSGATVYLFRYADAAGLRPGAERRLVPVPVRDAPMPVPVGTWCLRVVSPLELAPSAPVARLEVGDVLVSVAGHPIQDVILVPFTSGAIQALDRLVRVDDEPIREAYDVARLYRLTAEHPGRRFVFTFERDGREFGVEAEGLADLGINAYEPDSIVYDAPCWASLWRDGDLIEIDVPGGLVARTTCAPLFPSRACEIGRTPVAGVELEPGRYVALLRADGRADVRVPFVVPRGDDVHRRVRLDPIGVAPDRFVRVASGRFAAGGDARAFAPLEPGTPEVDDFWMCERESTWEEWATFLNDPATQAVIDASPTPTLFPRSLDGALIPEWRRGPDGSFSFPSGRRLHPISSVSWHDARAFAAWLTRVFREQFGSELEFDLPTELEWEKAARGVDGRFFPFGDTFDPTWVKSRFAREVVEQEPCYRFPRDESPYGVYDLCGGQWEWCLDAWGDATSGRTARGGSWSMIYEANFRAATRAELAADVPNPDVGVRMVARRPGSAGSLAAAAAAR